MIGVLASCLISAASLAAPVQVILDTDLGDDIDDTWALAQLVAAPEVEVKLVVTAFRNTPAKAELVSKMLAAMECEGIPLGIGPKTGDQPLNHDPAWRADFDVAAYRGEVLEDGVQALIDTVHAIGEGAVICVIGPQTNIGAALDRDPSIAEHARIVSMAGSVRVGYNGSEKPSVEWNVKGDIPAIRKVFAAPWPITFAPLDSCGTLRLEGERYQTVADSDAPLAKMVIENYTGWKNRKHYGEDQSSILFDTAAVQLCFDESPFVMETVKLSIDDEGMTVEDEEHGRPVACAMDWQDRDKFETMLVERLTDPKGAGGRYLPAKGE